MRNRLIYTTLKIVFLASRSTEEGGGGVFLLLLALAFGSLLVSALIQKDICFPLAL